MEGPPPAIGQDNNSLLTWPQDLCPGEPTTERPWHWQVSPRWFEFAALWATGLGRDLQVSPVFCLAPAKTTEVTNPGPTEKGTAVLTLWSCCYAASPGLGTGCGRWGRTGGMVLPARTRPQAGVVLSRTLLLLVVRWTGMVFPVLCLLNISHFVPSLSGGGDLFLLGSSGGLTENESDCWVDSEMLSSSPSGLHGHPT